jgi:hypothetical protein
MPWNHSALQIVCVVLEPIIQVCADPFSAPSAKVGTFKRDDLFCWRP